MQKPLVIGWTGSHSTLIYLNVVIDILRELRKKYDFRFLIIANEPPTFNDDFITFKKWQSNTEVEDLKPMDIGIMPLTHTPWSEGKCGLKILQYQAMGIPALASGVGVNNEIIQHGVNGFICNTPDDWYQSLAELITNESLRSIMGERGRIQTVNHYSVSATREKFIGLFH